MVATAKSSEYGNILNYFVLRHGKTNDPGAEMSYQIGLSCPRDNRRPLMPMTRWIFAHMRFIRREQ